ncbi:MAG: sensor domain-containing diguanylate cyclase [Nitrospirota bacterium]|nr:sensor domain-containing diguanylate cyclase [Nitrospirota bacterium]
MDRKTLILNFRWLTLLLAAGLVQLSGPGLFGDAALTTALVMLLGSNLILHAGPAPLFEYRPHWFLLVLFDLFLVSVAVQRLGAADGEAFFLYLPVVGLAACIHGQPGLFATVAVTAGVYGGLSWLDLRAAALAGGAAPDISGLAFRSAMLAAMGAAFGYMAQRVRIQTVGQQLAEARRRDLEMVVRANHRLGASLNQGELLGELIRTMAELVSAWRCSVVHLDADGQGTILVSREILAADERAATRTLRIRMADYPELAQATATGQVLRLSDVADNPLTAPVRGKLAQVGIRSLLVVPLTLGDRVLGTLMLSLAKRRGIFSERDAHVAELVANMAAGALKNAYIHETLEAERHSLHQLAVTDPLTSVYNRRFFDMRLEEEFLLAERHSLPLSLIMLDVDHFKRINDSHGHTVGDKVLVELARVVGATLRQTDCFARFGGEEFVILMPLTDRMGAESKAEEIRLAVKEITLPVKGESLRISVSLGVSSGGSEGSDQSVSLLQAADRAVYAAKRAGRDQVRFRAPRATPGRAGREDRVSG